MVVADGRCDVIDGWGTTGMSVSPDGTRLARLVRPTENDAQPTLLTVTDRHGPVWSRRVPIVDAHSLLWTEHGLAAASTGANRVEFFDEDGVGTGRWTPGGVGDCWHLNSLVAVAGRLAVSAFGVFSHHREWHDLGPDGHGVVYDVERAEVLVGGLHSPHDPVVTDDGWVICNSGTSEFLRVGPNGEVADRVDLGGWTRGVALHGDHWFVGVTPVRDSDRSSAWIAVVDRERFEQVDEIDTPSTNIFALAVVDGPLLGGLRLNARSASLMVPGPPRLGTPLSADDCAVDLEIVANDPTASSDRQLTVRVTNHGSADLASVGDLPVLIGVRQRFDDSIDDLGRIHLPFTIRPGRCETFTVVQRAVGLPRVAVELSVMQEGVRWMCDVWPGAATTLVLADEAALADETVLGG